MNTQKKFFDQNNYELLFNLIRDEFIRKLEYDIDNQTDKSFYPEHLAKIMSMVYNQNKSVHDITDLNKITLKNTLPLFANHIKRKKDEHSKINVPTRDKAHTIRDVDTSVRGETTFLPMRPNQSIELDSSEDVSRNFDHLNTNRQNELTQRPPLPDFKIPQNSELSNDDSDKRYEFESKRREFELTSKVPHIENSLTPIDVNELRKDNDKNIHISYSTSISDSPQTNITQSEFINQQPGMMNQQPGMMNQQPGMMNQQPGMMNQQPGMMNQQPEMMNQQSELMNQQPEMMNQQSELMNQPPGMLNQQTGMMNQQQGMMNKQQGMMNQQPGMMNQQPGMMNQQPGMMNQQPGKMNQQPGMMNQQPGMIEQTQFMNNTPDINNSQFPLADEISEGMSLNYDENTSEIDKQFQERRDSMLQYENKVKELELNDQNFSDRLKQIQSIRQENFFDNMKDNRDNSDQNVNVNNQNSWESTLHNSLMDDNSKRLQERVLIEKDIQSQPKMEPKELFRKNEKNEKLLEEKFIKDQMKREEDIVQILEKKTIPVSYLVSINSSDREFETEINDISYPNNKNIVKLENKIIKSRYNFQIKFAPADDEWVESSIYINNKTVPASEKEAKNGLKGLPNTNGFWLNGRSYKAYDENKPHGEIIGREYILFKGTTDASVPQIYRNVKSITVEHVILPVDFIILNYAAMANYEGASQSNPNQVQEHNYFNPKFLTNLVSYPYLLLYIDEIDGVFTGSNDAARRAFCQLIPTRDYSANKINAANYSMNIAKDMGYVHMQPIGDGKKEFKTLLSILNRLTVRILSPLGKELRVPKDILFIESVYSGQDSDKKTIVDTKTKQKITYQKNSVLNGRGNNMVEYKIFNSYIHIKLRYQETDNYNWAHTGILTSGSLIQLKYLENSGNLFDQEPEYDDHGKLNKEYPWTGTEIEKLEIMKFLTREEGHFVLGVNNIIGPEVPLDLESPAFPYKPNDPKDSKTLTWDIFIENYTNYGNYNINTIHDKQDNIPDNFKKFYYNYLETSCKQKPCTPEQSCKEITMNKTENGIYSDKTKENARADLHVMPPILFDLSLQNNIVFKITTEEVESSAPIYGVNT